MVGPPSIKSSEGGISNMIKSMGQKTSPHIHIAINDQDDSFISTFSTMDKIEGAITVTYPVNTQVSDFQINFVGSSKTFVERLTSSTAVSGRTEAFHQFLKLAMPINPSEYPTNMMFEGGKAYKFNFNFVVPQQLLPRVCRHDVNSDTVHQEHLNLPPSMGDRQVSGRGQTLLDDFSPDMARIKYAITATIQEASYDGSSSSPIVRGKKVRILPRIEEKPPVNIEGDESDYVLRSEKDIRKGVFKGKLGRLVVETAQPKAIHVPSHTSEDQALESSVATLNLRFDPIDSKAQPPTLGNLSTKFKIATFFSSAARSRMPSKKDVQWDLNQGIHSETLNLATRCVAVAEWQQHTSSQAPSRRSSTASSIASSTSTIPEPTEKYAGGTYYTARVIVPISLPNNRVWIPTFHSCLISRIYSLSLHLGIQNAGLASGLDLKLPVQITSEGNPAALEDRGDGVQLSEEEMAAEALEADELFAPRSLGPAAYSREEIGRMMVRSYGGLEAPPGYDAFARRMPVAV